jgi:DtxR family transcriptional regulator, Mn-dependent transcriptional regulator
MSDPANTSPALSDALEDYLETIFELVRDNKLARVKDIARNRDVRSASVIPALRRLSELGLISYEKREYIDLTPEGEAEARKIYSKHKILNRFFRDVLNIPPDYAQKDACLMEHSLSKAGMNQIVKFLEFVQSCPRGAEIIKNFQECTLVNESNKRCDKDCVFDCQEQQKHLSQLKSLAQLKPGQTAIISRIAGSGPIRQRIIDIGLIPGVHVFFERVSPANDPVWIKFQGTQLSLRLKEAQMIMVEIANDNEHT